MFKLREKMFIMIIIYKKIFERVRDENDRDLYLKSFENKNVKNLFLNSRVSKFIKFNRDDNVKLSHIQKNDEDKRKNEYKIEYKNFSYFHCDKKGYIKSHYSNKDKSIIYIIVITTKNDSVSQSPQKRNRKNEK